MQNTVQKYDEERIISCIQQQISLHLEIVLKIQTGVKWCKAVKPYLRNIYSSRKIERQLQEHIHYMWLSGGARPDFRTINYFRGKRLKDTFDDIFTQVVELLHPEGFVSLEVQYIDGTKIESASNKYTFVWRGSIEKYDARLRGKTRRILSEAEQVLEMESHEKG